MANRDLPYSDLLRSRASSKEPSAFQISWKKPLRASTQTRSNERISNVRILERKIRSTMALSLAELESSWRFLILSVCQATEYYIQHGWSNPLGLVVPFHWFEVLSNTTTGRQLFTVPPKPGACILNMNLSLNTAGCNLCIERMAAFETTSKLLRWFNFRISCVSEWALFISRHIDSG